MIEMGRDTLENWQSKFLQLLWQVGGLSFLLYLGSPQSKEGSDRMEANVGELLRRIDPEPAAKQSVLSTHDMVVAARTTNIPSMRERDRKTASGLRSATRDTDKPGMARTTKDMFKDHSRLRLEGRFEEDLDEIIRKLLCY